MFCKNFVGVVKCGGKILRERDGNVVYVPFGAEYSILLKNLSSRKASVKIEIDGVDVLNGNSLIVNSNSEIELERFLKKMDKGNRFKFIQKTKEIQDYRGDKIDDGIVRITYQFEKEVDYGIYNCFVGHYPNKIYNNPGYEWHSDSTYTYSGLAKGIETSCCSNLRSCSLDSSESFTPEANEGITVPGSISNQKFTYGSIGILEDTIHTITLQLRGESKGVEVTKPLTVEIKLKCQTCGRKNKHNSKFCSNCGTALEII